MMGFAVLTFETEVGFTQKRVNPKISLQNHYLAMAVKKDRLKGSKMFLLFCMVSRQPDHKSISILHSESKRLAR